MAERRRWGDLSRAQRTAIVVGATIELVLTAVALADLARRPAAQVRGTKPLWAVGCLVQPVGPVAYLVFGRHR